MSDTTDEFVPGTEAFKRERSLSVVFGFFNVESLQSCHQRKSSVDERPQSLTSKRSVRYCGPIPVIAVCRGGRVCN